MIVALAGDGVVRDNIAWGKRRRDPVWWVSRGWNGCAMGNARRIELPVERDILGTCKPIRSS